MNQPLSLFLLFLIQLVILFFISRQTINTLFAFLRRFLPDRPTFILITLIFLPGTVMHEMAHYIMAVVLMLKVKHVSVLPEFEKDHIKLGKVVYEKKDIFRGILVGIAPIFFGLFIFWVLSIWQLFPNQSMGISILVGYFIFVISSTMFSSKQDLVDLIYIIPLAILTVGIIIFFNIDILRFLKNDSFLELISKFIMQLNIYFFFSFIIHIGIIIFVRLFLKLVK
jgi:hypothetical protein